MTINELRDKWQKMLDEIETDVKLDREEGRILAAESGEEAVRLIRGMIGELKELNDE